MAAYATVTAHFGRIFRIYGVAISVILAYVFLSKVALRATAALFGTTDVFEDALYSWAHRRIAPRVCAQLQWIGSADLRQVRQYIGGRTDMVPPVWAAELCSSRMTTALPPPLRRRAVRDAFGRRIATSSPTLRTRRRVGRRWRRCTSPACATAARRWW